MAAAARLVWERADGTSVEFRLGADALVVGRDDGADIRVDEALVSRAHARLERRPDGYFVVDLGSTNYTRVNGEAVAERLLRHGDEVRFARAVCRFLADGGVPAADPLPPRSLGDIGCAAEPDAGRQSKVES